MTFRRTGAVQTTTIFGSSITAILRAACRPRSPASCKPSINLSTMSQTTTGERQSRLTSSSVVRQPNTRNVRRPRDRDNAASKSERASPPEAHQQCVLRVLDVVSDGGDVEVIADALAELPMSAVLPEPTGPPTYVRSARLARVEGAHRRLSIAKSRRASANGPKRFSLKLSTPEPSGSRQQNRRALPTADCGRNPRRDARDEPQTSWRGLPCRRVSAGLARRPE